MPAFLDQLTPPELARRRRRARAWLALTVALAGSMLALTLTLLPLGRITQAGPLAIIVALSVAPVAGLLWWERRSPSATAPHKWPWRALAVTFPQAIALGFALNAVLDEAVLARPLRLLLIFALPLIPAATAELARRSLLRPLVAELGAGDVEVLVEPRTAHRPWFSSDSIALSSREIVITVRSGSGRAAYQPRAGRIALADITAVGARPALPQDSPWITLSDGRGLSVPPGDVVVIQCGQQGHATRVLPVADAAVFAEMIRTRVSRVRGTTIAAPPLQTGERPAMPEHLPELQPAPESSGPLAHPVSAAVAQPRTGPGMALRWALGLPLALLGIAGVPLVLLLYGGLLPPGTDLARARLVLCVLWTALAAGIWFRSLRQPRYWPVWALTSGLVTAVIVVVQGPGLLALLGPVIAVALTWAGRQILIRPISTDLAGSRLEIPVRLPGGVTLLVQRDRMLLKVPGGGGGAVPQAMPLAEVTLVQPGQLTGDEVRYWPFPGARMRIGRGPVLRLVAGPQQWLIPVQAPYELTAIIRGRAVGAPSWDIAGGGLTLTQWHELRSWAAQQLTKDPRAGGLRQRTVGFRLAIALPSAFLGTALLSESIGRGVELGSGAVVAGGLLVVAVAAAGDWVRVRRRLRVAEDNALPPGSPDWGDLRADHAPLEGWQPWDEGSRSAAPVGGQ